MDYTQLSADEQYRVVAAKVRQYEQAYLVATVDLAASQASDEKTQSEGLQSQVAKWEAAVAAGTKILDAMPKPCSSAAAGSVRNS